MSRLMFTSDLHLGHKNICKHRDRFDSAEEHHEVIFDNLASNITKRDSLILLGDIAFDKYWLEKIKSIKCVKKLLICGNHDLDFGIKMRDLVDIYDDVKALYSRRNCWLSHMPIHEGEFRSRVLNIHGHLHYKKIDDSRYFNACVEHTNWEPISFKEIIERSNVCI